MSTKNKDQAFPRLAISDGVEIEQSRVRAITERARKRQRDRHHRATAAVDSLEADGGGGAYIPSQVTGESATIFSAWPLRGVLVLYFQESTVRSGTPNFSANCFTPKWSMYAGRSMDALHNTFRVVLQRIPYTSRSVTAKAAALHTSCMGRKTKKTTKIDPLAIESGTRIRECRVEKGWRQEDVAAATGWNPDLPAREQPDTLSATRIANFEQGTRRVGFEEALILSRALGRPAAYFMGVITNQQANVIAAMEQQIPRPMVSPKIATEPTASRRSSHSHRRDGVR